MMVTRAEAAEVVKSANLDIAEGDLSHIKVHQALKMAKQLNPHQGQLVVAELATRLWLRHLA